MIFEILDSICTTAPKFLNHDFTGLPFSAIFLDLMNNTSGQQFFSSPVVNDHLKNIFDAYLRMLESPFSLEYINTSEPNGWLSSSASANVDWSEFKLDVSKPSWGFTSYNDFFIR